MAAATARKIDENGFLFVKGCPISSFGIFDYGAGQLGLPGDPNRLVKVYRPESAVNDPDAMESFKNVPFIVDHEMLSGFTDDDEAEAPEDKGVDGVLTGNVYYEAPWMRGDLKIFSRKAQKALAQNKKDLSLGYSCDFDLTPGVFDGQAYEVVQLNLRGNHIALVDEGRVPGARVLDGLCFDHLNFDVRPSDEDQHMNKGKRSKAADNAVEQLKALIPALQQFLNEEAGEPEHQGATGGGEGDATPPNPDGSEGGAPAAEPAATDPTASAGGGGDVGQLIQQVEAILQQLKTSLAGGAGASAGEGSDEGEGTGEGAEGEDGLAAGDPPIGDEGNGEGAVQDEGSAGGSAEEGNGKASPGPAAGTNSMAGDSAVRRFYADSAAKGRLYDRLSTVVGAFDHKSMDSHQVALYGLKKLQKLGHLKGVKDAAAFTALDAYLSGVEAANKKNRADLSGQRRTNAGDSAFGKSDELESYLAGSK